MLVPSAFFCKKIKGVWGEKGKKKNRFRVTDKTMRVILHSVEDRRFPFLPSAMILKELFNTLFAVSFMPRYSKAFTQDLGAPPCVGA